MVTGARQVSKSTLLKHIAQSQGKYYQYINFDDPLQLPQASAEPMLFTEVTQPFKKALS